MFFDLITFAYSNACSKASLASDTLEGTANKPLSPFSTLPLIVLIPITGKFTSSNAFLISRESY